MNWPKVRGDTLPAATWANRPTASSVPAGTRLPVTGYGMFVSDGTYWKPQNGCLLLQTAGLPMIVPASGTLSAGGALTLAGTGTGFASLTSCYLYVPANTTHSGDAAGWYYTVMSSATAGTIYRDRYDPTTELPPAIPASPTSCTAANSYTQVTSEVTAMQRTVPGGMMGVAGELIQHVHTMAQGATDSKTTNLKFGGSTSLNTSQTANVNVRGTLRIKNIGLANANMFQTNTVDGAAASNGATLRAIATASDQVAIVTLTVGATTNNTCHGLYLYDLELRH